MNKPSATFSSNCNGTTLIEVLAGLALIASVLVGLLVTRGSAAEQHSKAERRLLAIEAADRLLESWWQSPDNLPINETGDTEHKHPFQWRTSLESNPEAQRLNARVLRLEVTDPLPHTDNPIILVSLEILIPNEADDTDTE